MVQRNSCILLCYWRPLLGTLLSYNMNPAVLVVPQRPSAALSTRYLKGGRVTQHSMKTLVYWFMLDFNQSTLSPVIKEHVWF